MWSKDSFNFYEQLANTFFGYFCVILTIFIIISPIDPLKATERIPVYKSQHISLQDIKIGSNKLVMSCEASTLANKILGRKCLFIKLRDLSIDIINTAISQNAGGILVLLQEGEWSDELRRKFLEIESKLLEIETDFPIYFSKETPEIRKIYDEVQNSLDKTDTNFIPKSLMKAVWSSGYQLSVAGGKHVEISSETLFNIQGSLNSNKPDAKTLLIVAHYDSSSGIPALSTGYESNGSGVAVLLEIARIFSKLYEHPETVGNYNLVFLLTNGGKHNFIGSDKWLKKMAKSDSGLALMDSIAQVLCLEGLSRNFDNQIRMHLSRVPRNGTASYDLLDALEVARKVHSFDQIRDVKYVHKKIDLTSSSLAWEHERFSIHRLPSLTLSTWPTHQHFKLRKSMLDGAINSKDDEHYYSEIAPDIISKNAIVIAEALARFVYGFDELTHAKDTLIKETWITKTSVKSLMDMLTGQSRSAAFHTSPLKRSKKEVVNLVTTFKSMLDGYNLQDVQIQQLSWADTPRSTTGKNSSRRVDTSDDMLSKYVGDFNVVFYSGLEEHVMTIYKLKGSVFDLVIACAVALYLFVICFISQRFGDLNDVVFRQMQALSYKAKAH